MTGITPSNGKFRPVNKRILASAVFAALVIIGSFSLREIYPDNKIIDKLFGGVSIILFWIISFFIYHKIDEWIFRKNKLEKSSFKKNNNIRIDRIIIIASISCVLFFITLKYLEGFKFMLFWTILILSLWIIGLVSDHRNKNKGTD
jgi:hypothetical protein